MSRIRIHPTFDAYYYSFYFEGLAEALPGRSIQFTRRGFPDIWSWCLMFTVEHDGATRRIVIDGTDGAGVRADELEWCDVYGKVNLADDVDVDRHHRKLVAIGPGFATRAWTPLGAALCCARTFLAGSARRKDPREHVANFVRQHRYRTRRKRYRPGSGVDSDYVFHLSSLWSEAPEINAKRALFIDACRAIPGLEFEGGFAPFLHGFEATGHDDKLSQRRYTLDEWLDATARSCVVFNTPAVADCHGWKLAEYLALGKAVVSTELSRRMPAPFEHGTHAHFVDDDVDSMREAIERIRGDDAYRSSLETNARRYYDAHLAPGAVISRLLEHSATA